MKAWDRWLRKINPIIKDSTRKSCIMWHLLGGI
jgi:hypothetical protein